MMSQIVISIEFFIFQSRQVSFFLLLNKSLKIHQFGFHLSKRNTKSNLKTGLFKGELCDKWQIETEADLAVT